ncbi:hypothetical protein DFH06DRAFT_1127592 [Mycena polygramma]|nr:hypothetical protein DFH06DRAFT_1127592 [Mycena polygramma]
MLSVRDDARAQQFCEPDNPVRARVAVQRRGCKVAGTLDAVYGFTHAPRDRRPARSAQKSYPLAGEASNLLSDLRRDVLEPLCVLGQPHDAEPVQRRGCKVAGALDAVDGFPNAPRDRRPARPVVSKIVSLGEGGFQLTIRFAPSHASLYLLDVLETLSGSHTMMSLHNVRGAMCRAPSIGPATEPARKAGFSRTLVRCRYITVCACEISPCLHTMLSMRDDPHGVGNARRLALNEVVGKQRDESTWPRYTSPPFVGGCRSISLVWCQASVAASTTIDHSCSDDSPVANPGSSRAETASEQFDESTWPCYLSPPFVGGCRSISLVWCRQSRLVVRLLSDPRQPSSNAPANSVEPTLEAFIRSRDLKPVFEENCLALGGLCLLALRLKITAGMFFGPMADVVVVKLDLSLNGRAFPARCASDTARDGGRRKGPAVDARSVRRYRIGNHEPNQHLSFHLLWLRLWERSRGRSIASVPSSTAWRLQVRAASMPAALIRRHLQAFQPKAGVQSINLSEKECGADPHAVVRLPARSQKAIQKDRYQVDPELSRRSRCLFVGTDPALEKASVGVKPNEITAMDYAESLCSCSLLICSLCTSLLPLPIERQNDVVKR